jgi:hypothetical protein
MLGSDMTLDNASAGFKNQGQFIAALHVSQNLNIPFKDLKAAMLGTTVTTTGGTATGGTTTGGTSTSTSAGPMSLGQAIHKVRPSAAATTEAQNAQAQASADLGTTSTSTSPTTTTATTTTAKKPGRR